MKTFTFEISQLVTVTIDETKFGQEQMAEFNKTISDYGTDDEAYFLHAQHLSRLICRAESPFSDEFIEGYGPLNAVGIKVEVDGHTLFDERVEEGR